jgi:hypothetical protein
MGFAKDLTQPEKQSILKALNRLAAAAGTGYLLGRNDGLHEGAALGLALNEQIDGLAVGERRAPQGIKA